MHRLYVTLTGLGLAAVFGFLILPLFVAASVSFTSEPFLTFPPAGFSWQWYIKILSAPEWRSAILDTIIIGCLCALIASVVGTLTAYGISRLPNALLRDALLVVFLAPLAVPYMSLGMAIYPYFAVFKLIGTHIGVALAQAILALPFVVIAVTSTIRRRDRDLERAARTLGATPIKCFWYVVLPLLMPGIAAGAVLAFMTSFDDVVMPIFLGGIRVSTIPKTMLDSLFQSSDPSVMAASTMISAVGLGLFLIVTLMPRRRGDAIRRQ